MSFNEESNVKLIPNEDIFRIRGNDKLYAEAMESMIKFNKQLLTERKSRIPFLDTQTGIAQSNAMLWHDRSHRSKSSKIGNVYKYSIKSWYKNRRSLFDKDSYSSNDTTNNQQPQNVAQQAQQVVLNETSNNSNSNLSATNLTGSNLISTTSLLNHLQQTTKSLNDNEYSSKQNLPSAYTNNNVLVDDWQDDTYEQFNNYNDENDSDYDDPDEYKPKRSSKKPKISKNKKAELVDDKPYTCDKCGAKYKTKPGLNYHIQKAHSSMNSSNNASSSNLSTLKINEILNNDENANSIFDSVYDDMNSSSSLRG